MQILLPKSGHTVHFKEWLSQRGYEAYLRELSGGLNPREVSPGLILNDKIDYAVVDAAVRATLPHVVERIVTADGREMKYTPNWSLDLSKSDFSLLALEVTRLKEEEEKAQAEGKKNSGEPDAVAGDEGGSGNS